MRKKLTVRRGGKGQPATTVPDALVGDVRQLIEEARQRASVAVNAGLTLLYWRVGERLGREILGGERAAYGEQVIGTLAVALQRDYGRGFAEKSLRRMVQFSQAFPEPEIVATLSRQLSWSHFVLLLPLKAPLARDFYAEMCRTQRWSVRALARQIDSMLYERTAISRRPEAVVKAQVEALRERDLLSPELLFKDPYVLDFLGVGERYLEKDLEDAILRELETFLLELGSGFCFVARQMRLQIDGDDFYVDLVFYNRKLKRLIALELKVGDFKPEYKGQMELYLRWLDRHAREADEGSPLGIILCAGKRAEQIELLELDKTGIHVAEYLTVLPPRDELTRKLHAAIANSRERLTAREVTK